MRSRLFILRIKNTPSLLARAFNYHTSEYRRRKPDDHITNICLDIFKSAWIFPHAITGPLLNKAWAALFDVPVVINKMMESGLRDRSSSWVALFVFCSLDHHSKVERAT